VSLDHVNDVIRVLDELGIQHEVGGSVVYGIRVRREDQARAIEALREDSVARGYCIKLYGLRRRAEERSPRLQGSSRARQGQADRPITMSYDKENRLSVHQSGASVATYAYSGDGLKRLELVDGVATTLVWDGSVGDLRKVHRLLGL
jgi:hypothetical protein